MGQDVFPALFCLTHKKGTNTLKLTEEKWLLDLYGQDYADYRKRVNRCMGKLSNNL